MKGHHKTVGKRPGVAVVMPASPGATAAVPPAGMVMPPPPAQTAPSGMAMPPMSAPGASTGTSDNMPLGPMPGG